MMGRQTWASVAIVRLWEPHNPGRSWLPTPSSITSPIRQPHRTPEPWEFPYVTESAYCHQSTNRMEGEVREASRMRA